MKKTLLTLNRDDQWAVKKRIGAKMFMIAIKLNPLHSLGLKAQAELTYSLRRGIKILAFPLKPCPASGGMVTFSTLPADPQACAMAGRKGKVTKYN